MLCSVHRLKQDSCLMNSRKLLGLQKIQNTLSKIFSHKYYLIGRPPYIDWSGRLNKEREKGKVKSLPCLPRKLYGRLSLRDNRRPANSYTSSMNASANKSPQKAYAADHRSTTHKYGNWPSKTGTKCFNSWSLMSTTTWKNIWTYIWNHQKPGPLPFYPRGLALPLHVDFEFINVTSLFHVVTINHSNLPRISLLPEATHSVLLLLYQYLMHFSSSVFLIWSAPNVHNWSCAWAHVENTWLRKWCVASKEFPYPYLYTVPYCSGLFLWLPWSLQPLPHYFICN